MSRAGTSPRDDGQVMLLSIGYAVLALLLVTAVISASSVHLERKRLLAVADLAALAAADAMDDRTYFARDSDELVVLTDADVRESVTAYLGRAAPDVEGLDDLAVVESTTDGRTVTVTLRALARPALVSWVTAPWSDGIVLVVTTSARAG